MRKNVISWLLIIMPSLEEKNAFLLESMVYANFQMPLVAGRLFKKIELNESIRYASGDPIEAWLNNLLCLDVANCIPNISR